MTFQSNIFKGKAVASKDKLRGGYYTPKLLADYLVDWAVRTPLDKVLEPSCGDGNFLVALANLKKRRFGTDFNEGQVCAVELNPEELSKAKSRAKDVALSNVEFFEGDFFNAYHQIKATKFDVVVGNPPFIRFQYFKDESRENAFDILRGLNYKPTGLANAWSAFVQIGIDLLNVGGRMAMVVPAELLQVKYAAELRDRITRSFEHVVLVAFKKIVFPDIQQEVVLLLAEGKREELEGKCDIQTLDIENVDELNDLDGFDELIAHAPHKHERPGMKWTSLFVDDASFECLDKVQKHESLSLLGELASVDVGIVTGRNSFFILDSEQASRIGSNGFFVDIVGRTGALNSISFTPSDFKKYQKTFPSRLLNTSGYTEKKFTKKIKEYIALGEQEKVNTGYKCRIRSRWYDVPSVKTSDAFLFRQIHRFPLLVLNSAKVNSTDTIHRVNFNEGVEKRNLVVSFFNSLTLAWSEVCGRSYGGGVLELEPREAEELPIPYFSDADLDYKFVDRSLRSGEWEKALNYVDDELLHGRMGLSKRDIAHVRGAWSTLRDRRINRK